MEVTYEIYRYWETDSFKYGENRFEKYIKNEVISFASKLGVLRPEVSREVTENLQLLEGRSNDSKNAMRLVDYYNDMNDEQKAELCKEELIPEGVSLELENFKEYYEKRKALLTTKIRLLLG